jgi:hypothetical protein
MDKMIKALMLLLAVFSFSLSTNAGSPTIKISKGTNNGIVVRGTTGSLVKWYWLGVSYKIGNGQERDLKSGIFRCKGPINKKFSPGIIASPYKGKTITWYAKLWKKKTKKSKCTRRGCRWCMFNGYHFEGQVASTSGTSVIQ